jgi:hypothetical protein
MSEDNKPEIGYVFNFAADLGNGRQLSLNGNLNKGATTEEMNAEVDKIRAVFDRQQAKSAARAVEDDIESFKVRLAAAESDFEAIEKKNAEKLKLNATEVQHREAAIGHIDKMKKDLEYKANVLVRLKKEAE